MTISVIIPVFNGAASLGHCLNALAKSRYTPIECIVVDDGSTDDSAAIARQSGAVVIPMKGRTGPARARNLGARHAQGNLLLFVDADVALQNDALARIAAKFEAAPDLDALIGSYDDSPADPGFVSQFKNLMHSFVHHQGNRQAISFWCGCGAVKRAVYLEHGGLDESYRRASIEDIELGFRMMKAGRKLELDPKVRCKHLKVWTFWNLLYTDVFQRGIPWTQLILRTGFLPNDLNLRWSQRASTFLSGLLILLLSYGGWQTIADHAGVSVYWTVAAAVVSLATIAGINWSFYKFLATRKGWKFALAAFPLHILYYIYSGISFGLGVAVHLLRSKPSPASASKVLVPRPGED